MVSFSILFQLTDPYSTSVSGDGVMALIKRTLSVLMIDFFPAFVNCLSWII